LASGLPSALRQTVELTRFSQISSPDAPTPFEKSGLGGCLDSIAAAFAQAAPLDAEIVVVDNGSTDETSELVRAWTAAHSVPVQLLYEPRAGKGASLNRALLAARGQLLAFTDDDCWYHPEYANDLLRHDAADTELVLRGGRVELGDPTDLPLTISTDPARTRVSRAMNSARRTHIAGRILGCNMVARRAVIERVGLFDEDFGPGALMQSGDETEYMFRAYLAGIALEHVPDMTVFHHHGRKTAEAGYKLWRSYMIGNGAIYVKYFVAHPNLCRAFYWDIKNALIEIVTGTNTFEPAIGFSHKQKVIYSALGAIKYLFANKHGEPQNPFQLCPHPQPAAR
jgi:glycosyltransferase involved in cell wall biosynthesis